MSFNHAALRSALGAAALSPAKWPAVHVKLQRRLGATGINMSFVDRWTGARAKPFFTGFEKTIDYDKEMQRILFEDPWLQPALAGIEVLQSRGALIMQGAAQISQRDLERTRYFNEICRPTDCHDHLSIGLRTGGRWDGFVSANAHAITHFNADHAAFLDSIAGEILESFSFGIRLSLHVQHGAFHEAILQDVDLPIVVLRSNRLLYANEKALCVIESGAVFRLFNGNLSFACESAQERLLAAQSSAERSETASGAVRWYMHDGTGDTWLVETLKLRGGDSGLLSLGKTDSTVTIVILTKTTGAIQFHPASLKRITSLTVEERERLHKVVLCGSVAAARRAYPTENPKLLRWSVYKAKKQLGINRFDELIEVLPALGIVKNAGE